MTNSSHGDYFASDSTLDELPPPRAPESLDLGTVPSTIRDRPSTAEANVDGVRNNSRSSSIRQAISNIADRGPRTGRLPGRLPTVNPAGTPERPLLHRAPQPTSEYPQRGWANAQYYNDNPWYGEAKERPIFSLGKPLPHIVRRRTKRPAKSVERGDLEQGIWTNQPIDDEAVQDGEVDTGPVGPVASNLTNRTSRTQAIPTHRDIQRQQSRTTAAGVAHSEKRNDAGQPVFDYVPGEAERVEQPPAHETTRTRTSTNPERQMSRVTELTTGPSHKVDGEPLGHQERPEVEQGFKDPDEMRNRWARFREKHREPLAEFLATGMAIFMGLAGTLSVNLSANTETAYGNYETSCWAWGFAWMFGIYLGGGVSGAHMNPAISISLSLFRGFPWRQCAVYICAQFLASLTAGALAYGCYADSIHHVDPQMTGLSKTFFSTPQEWVSMRSAFGNQVVGSAVMMIAVFALGDDQNNPPGAGMHALVLGFLVTALKFTLGFNIGSALNPASDFGPRVIAYAVGYREHNVFASRWWLYGPWLATLLGSVLGCTVYDGCVFVGSESPINYRMSEPLKTKARKLYAPLMRERKSKE